jgi:hypothetical protein
MGADPGKKAASVGLINMLRMQESTMDKNDKNVSAVINV